MRKRHASQYANFGSLQEEFSLIESIGIANLSSDQLKDMVEKYFIH